MYKIVIKMRLILAGVFVATAAVNAANVPLGTQPTLPYFEAAKCMFAVPDEISRCGYVHVPQNRRDLQGLSLSLAVKIYPSFSSSPERDPVILLVGGPGNPSAFYQIHKDYEKRVAPFRDKRDVIVVDQRGNGFSTPTLHCPEFISDMVESYQDYRTINESQQMLVASMARCRESLMGQGIRLESYNSNENADDINDIRRALGYSSMNLAGWSYGSRLAFNTIRRHGEVVRSAMLGSIYPTTSSFLHGIAGAEVAFQRLFRLCREDAACNDAYPNLEKVFQEATARYDATPLKLDIHNPLPNSVMDGVTVQWLFTGGQISGVLYGEMYSAELIGRAPHTIYEIAAGNERLIKELVTRNILIMPAYINFGQLLAFTCMDTMAFERQQLIDMAVKLHAGAGALEYGRIYTMIPRGIETCNAFVDLSQADKSFISPVFSDVPVIMFNGDLDSATPVDDALDAASSFSNSQLYILPGVGHDPMLEGSCPIAMLKQFIENPMQTVDSSCLDLDFPGVTFTLPDTIQPENHH